MTSGPLTLQCPKCQAPMNQYERNGVVVDQCTDCRGLFLDRGELERLVSAEAAWNNQAPVQQAQQGGGYQQHGGYQQPRHKKRKSFLEELFD